MNTHALCRRLIVLSLLALPAVARAELLVLHEPKFTVASGQTILAIGASVALILIAILLFRWRARRRFSFSLRWLMAFCLACSITAWGGVRWHVALQQWREYNAALPLKKKLARLISFEFVDTPFDDAVKFFSSLTKVPITPDRNLNPKPRGSTLRLIDVKFENALQWFAVQAGVECKVENGGIRIVSASGKTAAPIPSAPPGSQGAQSEAIAKSLKRKVTFEFSQTPFPDALAFLRQLGNTNLVADPKVLESAPPITLQVKDEDFESTLRSVLKQAKADFIIRDEAIFIFRPEAESPSLIKAP